MRVWRHGYLCLFELMIDKFLNGQHLLLVHILSYCLPHSALCQQTQALALWYTHTHIRDQNPYLKGHTPLITCVNTPVMVISVLCEGS